MVRIASSHAVIHPDAMSLIAICALIASLAMFRSWWLDNFALRTKLMTRHLLKQMIEIVQLVLVLILLLEICAFVVIFVTNSC